MFLFENPKWPPEAIKIVTYKEFDIYSFLKPRFHLFFHGELISGLLFRFQNLIRVLFAKI